MNCLNVSIQAPGRGRTRTAAGKMDRSRYGVESPIAITVKTRNDSTVESVRAAPRAGARNGALHGVATTVARTPVKNDPLKPVLLWRPEVTAKLTSKTPLKLRANTSITAARPKTKA